MNRDKKILAQRASAFRSLFSKVFVAPGLAGSFLTKMGSFLRPLGGEGGRRLDEGVTRSSDVTAYRCIPFLTPSPSPPRWRGESFQKAQLRNVCFGLVLCLLQMVYSTSLVAAQTSIPDEGFTEPLRTVLVASAESGVIDAIEVKEGDLINKGDVICRLDCNVLKVALLAAELKLETTAELEAAQSTLENKQHHLEQMQALLQKNHASDKEVKQAQLEYDLAMANLKTARADVRRNEIEVQKIKAQIDRRIIRSPHRGVVLKIPHEQGESVTTAESHVATVVQLDQLRVRYFLTTQQAMRMKRGGEASVMFPATDQVATAQVNFISPVTDSNSGTVRVELLIDNQRGKFRSGLRCVLKQAEATVATGQRSGFIQFN